MRELSRVSAGGFLVHPVRGGGGVVVSGPVRILVTGSRLWVDAAAVEEPLTNALYDVLQAGLPGVVVVHGAAPGADSLADVWAWRRRDWGVACEAVAADWAGPCVPGCPPGHRRVRRGGGDYCPLAGHRRNQVMVDRGATVCLAFPLGRSTGTRDCMRRAAAEGIRVLDLGLGL
ncbi:SLOG family protein [Kitasatospora sp. NPDC004745]|uniref:SLOG family protein n=1 Tax=Kitasatospora sp. NPDC004745 TaxID=3364019 RepID=UPI0036B4C644